MTIQNEIQKLYSNQLDAGEVDEAQNALVGFMELLIEIDRENKEKENKDGYI